MGKKDIQINSLTKEVKKLKEKDRLQSAEARMQGV